MLLLFTSIPSKSIFLFERGKKQNWKSITTTKDKQSPCTWKWIRRKTKQFSSKLSFPVKRNLFVCCRKAMERITYDLIVWKSSPWISSSENDKKDNLKAIECCHPLIDRTKSNCYYHQIIDIIFLMWDVILFHVILCSLWKEPQIEEDR